MRWTRQPEAEAAILNQLRASLAAEARTEEEIHVSDLLAPRQAYWSRVLPLPPTDDEVGYWIAGRGHEDAVGRLPDVHRGATHTVDGILLRPDFEWGAEGEILEMKTRRRALVDTPEEADQRYASYARQCLSYAALLGEGYARLIILGLVHPHGDGGATRPAWQVWRIEFTPEEIAREVLRLRATRDALRAAWAARDPKDVPLCEAWLCGKAIPHMATKPRCETCQRDFERDWGITKHRESKSGAGHVVTPATYTWGWEPRCRWWSACQPYRVDPTRGPRQVAATADAPAVTDATIPAF
jgi:hypothetical protein